MAAPIGIDGALVRRALRRKRVFRDRQDPLALLDPELVECYRFSREGVLFVCGLLSEVLQQPFRLCCRYAQPFGSLPRGHCSTCWGMPFSSARHWSAGVFGPWWRQFVP